jgi:phosphatidylglycerophosphate synthase
MGRSVDSTLDRLLVGSPLRRPQVAVPVIIALVAALLLSAAVVLLAVRSLMAEAAWLFMVGPGFLGGPLNRSDSASAIPRPPRT